MPQSIYFETLREIVNATQGVGIYGTINVGLLGSFEYDGICGVAPSVDLSSTGIKQAFKAYTYAFMGMTPPETVDVNTMIMTSKKSYSTTLTWNTPLEGLRLGATWGMDKLDLEFPSVSMVTSISTNRIMDVQMQNLIYSGEYKWHGLTLAGEYMLQKLKWDYNTPQLTLLATDRTLLGYYGSLAYRFTDWLEMGTYYSVLYPDKSDKHGDSFAARHQPDFMAWQDDVAFTVRFDVNSCWTIKLEGHHLNGTSYVVDYDTTDELSKKWSLYAVKTTFSF